MTRRTEFFCGEVWSIITKRIKSYKKKGKNPVLIAIPYMTDAAEELLPGLSKGDIVVCNASEEQIKSGSTSAAMLLKWKRKGVRVFSHPLLHAKLIVIGGRAFIGSANASKNSEQNLDEAIVSTTEVKAVREAKDFIMYLTQSCIELSKPDLENLQNIKISPRGPHYDKVQEISLPEKVNNLWIMSLVEGDELSEAQERKIQTEEKVAHRKARREGNRKHRITTIQRHSDDDNEPISINDWILSYSEPEEGDAEEHIITSACIEQVVHEVHFAGKKSILFLRRPTVVNQNLWLTKDDIGRNLANDIKKFSDVGSKGSPITGSKTTRYLKIFHENTQVK